MNIKEIPLDGRAIRIPIDSSHQTEEQKGSEFFPTANPSIVLFGKRKSGKSTVIFNCLERMCDKKTKVVIICPTIENDDSWIMTTKMLDKKKTKYIPYDSITWTDDNGVKCNVISDLLKMLKDGKPKHRYIIVIDDLDTKQVHSRDVDKLYKTFRHYHGTIITSTQAPMDLAPAARSNSEYAILFKGLPKKSIEQLHGDFGLTLDLEKFKKLYKQVCSEEHNFLYVQRIPDEVYRKNFNTLLEIDNSSKSEEEE